MSENGDREKARRDVENRIHSELVLEGDRREHALDQAMEEEETDKALVLGLMAISMRLKAIDFTLNHPNKENDIGR